MIRATESMERASSARAVLFDFDGTLANTKPTIVRIATEVLVEFGIPADVVASKVDEIIGPPFPDAFSIVFGLSPAEADEITTRYRSIYFDQGAKAWPLFDGIADLLAHLRGNGRLIGAASSKRQNMLERSISDNGVGDLFDVIVGKVDGVCDTKADAITRALRRLNVSTKEAVMVGDRRYDVKGAACAGIPCVGVLYGNTADSQELVDAGAMAVVDTVDELERVLLGPPTVVLSHGV